MMRLLANPRHMFLLIQAFPGRRRMYAWQHNSGNSSTAVEAFVLRGSGDHAAAFNAGRGGINDGRDDIDDYFH
jgi:hypothetical protein